MTTRALLVTALLLAGCPASTNSSTTPTATATAEPTAAPTASAAAPAPKPSPVEMAKKHIAEMEAAWAAKDAAKLVSFYTPDATLGMGGPAGWEEVPIAAVKKQFEALFVAFPDIKTKITRVLVKDDTAISQFVVTGTNTGEFMGQKATGKAIGYAGATVMTFSPDGKIKHENMYYDQGGLAGQLGLAPKGVKVRPAATLPTGELEILVSSDAGAKNLDIVKNMNELAMKNDQKGALALMADDVVTAYQYEPADVTGKAAVQKASADMMKAFVDQKVDVKVCIAAGDYVACETAWTATWKGPAMGMKPTGKTGTVHGVDVYKIAGDKIAKVTGYGNGLEFAGTFGLLDKK